jgi:hypothetical protein
MVDSQETRDCYTDTYDQFWRCFRKAGEEGAVEFT